MQTAKQKTMHDHLNAVTAWHAAMERANAARAAMVAADAELARATNALELARKQVEAANKTA